MSTKRLSLVLLSLLLIFSVMGISACQSGPDEQVLIEILNGGESVSLALHTGLADMINKYHPRIRASVTQTGGDEDSLIQAVGKDPTTLFAPNSFNYWGARYGVGGWDKSYPNVRMVSAHLQKTMNMFSNDPDIRTLEDLKGKKVVGLTGSVTTAMLEGMLDELGILDQVDIQYLGYGAQFNSFQDRLTVNVLDSVTTDPTTNTGHLGGSMTEALFSLKGDIYPVDWPQDLVVKASNNLGMKYIALENAPGTLETQDAAWHGISHGGHITLCTWAEADEEIIYEVTKIWVEHSQELKDYHPFGAFITPEAIVGGLGIASEDELHPGALKYYKEAGLWDNWPGPWGG